MTSLKTLICEVRAEEANQKKNFIRYATEIDTKVLAEKYEQIKAEAPSRHASERKYLFERDGVLSSKKKNDRAEEQKQSNRTEEHLAIALYHQFRKPGAMVLRDGQRIEVLDYQVPLKARQPDAGVGKVDMLGLIDGQRLGVLELKVKGGDTPLAATLEALVYAAILEANVRELSLELEDAGYGKLEIPRPDIIVLGPDDYWQEFQTHDPEWLSTITPGLCKIASALSLNLQFLELQPVRLTMGQGSEPPALQTAPGISTLYRYPV